ncbi:MAG: chromosomal replication initiator protein DnaA [Oscillospiraceae bacterium]|nr:chromosomal replication initiator protein DnaA [Oscillospiraceae bacterium]
MNSYADVWKIVLDRLKAQFSELTVQTWFDEIDVVTLEDSAFVLHCGNRFKKNMIEARFSKEIKAALKDVFSADLEVKILDNEQLEAYHGVRPDHPGGPEGSEGFTFETFVIGPQNKLAYAAARSVAEGSASKSYNPLFIYGDSGLGKTHLLYAISHQHAKTFPDHKIVYVKGDDFINDYVMLVRSGRAEEFRAKYRDADLLLVDDIQFVAGKEQVQIEFFYTFNALYEAGHQIVLTSDRPPREMTLLDDRLRTRFEWGLMADVAPPDYETRLAIIKNRAAIMGLSLPDSVTEYVAENITSNVRQIEGTLNKIAAYWDLLGSQLDEESVSRAIEDMLKKDNEFVPSPALIIAQTCKYYGVDEETIRGKNQGRDAVNARQVSMYLIRRMSNYSLEEIGKEFCGKDHSTVLHSLRKVEKQMREDPAFAETVKDLTANINARQ